ncbi:T9SS type A sorting domain-containing protein [Flavobacterium cellulosilyticum]|uniref:T9SS type A sorting domain-containing protein n=1 Tax=Flavobacterium cellulosilyticum TaxID=2541731 RepID=A0A4R5CLT6_9FLAO|nr:T9SS type A sorting domain-containing protein [Flavobacterium cellulosilyticum]TDD98424.1 T9SS type A sorting domain-containing protein [Flavobacterium cellulosilyticum]
MKNHKYIGLQNNIKNIKFNLFSYQHKTSKNILILIFLLLFKIVTIAQVAGCNDPLALNYNANATENNGSCSYNSTTITVKSSTALDASIKETSGLLEWNGYLYTHNDGVDTNLYKLDKNTGAILKSIPLPSIQNMDWEEISQDDSYIYIGDFGNNYSGNRTDLKIYKILKSTLESSPQIEIINFSYSNQTDFSTKTNNKTDFDCEAFVVTKNEILLFTKQWLSEKTSVYSLPKNAGTYVANLQTTLDVSGLITGATLKENLRLITLCGYSNPVQPFVFLIYDYKDNSFSTANKRKINISLPYHQIEAISTNNGLDYNVTNESLSIFTQKLHQFSLEQYLGNYLKSLSLRNASTKNNIPILFPNPAGSEIHIGNIDLINTDFEIVSLNGEIVQKGKLKGTTIIISDLEKGVYLIKFIDQFQVYKIIKK